MGRILVQSLLLQELGMERLEVKAIYSALESPMTWKAMTMVDLRTLASNYCWDAHFFCTRASRGAEGPGLLSTTFISAIIGTIFLFPILLLVLTTQGSNCREMALRQRELRTGQMAMVCNLYNFQHS